MEISELSESDSEFWLEFDKEKTLSTVESAKNQHKTNSSSIEQQTEDFLSSAPTDYYRDRFSALVNNIRTAVTVQFSSQFKM
jgi:hypothetical protein